MLVYRVTVPGHPEAQPAGDVVGQELTVTVGDGEPGEPVAIPAGGGETEVTCEEGESVTLSLVAVDDADPPNRSEPQVQTFVGHDTIPPAQAGQMGIVLDREE